MLLIRPAQQDDGPLAVGVLRRSISELCHEDHRDDAAALASWLANKTVEAWAVWLDRPDASVLVAERDGLLCGLGMVWSDGEILLDYVSPDARFAGVSKVILSALEEEASARGASSTSLESTRTARRFYLARGYRPQDGRGPLRMTKSLAGLS